MTVILRLNKHGLLPIIRVRAQSPTCLCLSEAKGMMKSMNRKQAIVWICMFVIMIVLFPISLFFINKTETENQEYRELAEIPSLTENNLDELIPQLENYINDHIPSRSQIIESVNLFKMKILNSSASDKVICGSDGWMYLTESVDWYRGEQLYSEEELNIIIDKLLFLSNKMKENENEFILFIAPNKATIYPEYLPETIGEKHYNKTEQLIEALEENEITYIFPTESIISQKDTLQLYAKRDTHWNSVGAYIASYELNKYMNTNIPTIDEIDIYPKEYEGEDLLRMMNLAGNWEKEEDYDFVGYAPGCIINMIDWDSTGNTIWYQTIGADNKKVYLLRDSFGHKMINFIAAGSSDFCVRHIDLFYPESIDEEAPDYLILELVERRLDELLHMTFN